MDEMDLDATPAPLDEEDMAALGERLETLPLDHAEWVTQLYRECLRARQSEAGFLASGCQDSESADTTQVVLDTADWLRTLWEVGYMGSEALPAPPRTDFPQINVEDILKSALFSRIRHGKRPLPFPPPTRAGIPWHEVVESDETLLVHAEVIGDGNCTIEGCGHWQVTATEAAGRSYRVQHRGKGPIYQLALDGHGGGSLRKRPAELVRRIVRQERAGIVAWLLEWPQDNGGITQVPLRAANWERAETEAQRWIALRHPDLYGQVQFERSEA